MKLNEIIGEMLNRVEEINSIEKELEEKLNTFETPCNPEYLKIDGYLSDLRWERQQIDSVIYDLTK